MKVDAAQVLKKKVRVGKVEEIPPGTKKLIQTELENVLVVNVEGEFYAVSNTCPHAGGYLNYGPLTGYVIECPLHFWPFDVRTGQLVQMEESGLEEQLNRYETLVEEGVLFILIPEFNFPAQL
ncbi:MAG TPA: Rieske 2Fe-2S domain-containing protein [Chloroflexia bacterium]|nr:Rieske 2Fe-2S domain-containing protein [Chloroflexia bacterium]